MRPHSNAPSDTLSEISEASTNGTERSSCYSDYRDELQEFATSLGYRNADELHWERFKVDRKRLEAMLLGKSESAGSAQEFFERVMNETQTMVKWPTQLKIGAKSKKDPHIKIFGIENNVKTAQHMVMTVLDTRSNRVTMKIDVSYTDHSHIIGKQGMRIKGVMLSTSCHIHFPDSNRNNQEEKSNQVSIAGEIANIERARAKVRELTPLIFCFELPNVGTLQNFPELNSEFVRSIQDMYDVQVMCRTRPKLHPTMVMVKGCEKDVEKLKEATLRLINHMCHSFASQSTVQMMMEISPQYHSLVLGAQQQNLKTIMRHTGVQVLFPDPGPNTPSLKKSSVIISGPINNVYRARQMLIGSLPLVLMFDYVPDPTTLSSGFLEEIMQSLDVYISVRPKPKQSIYSVIIKGLERNATGIYEARRRLIGPREKAVVADIPPSYQAPGPVPSFLKSFMSAGNNNFHNAPNTFLNNNNNNNHHHHHRAFPYNSIPISMLMKPLMQNVSNVSNHDSMTYSDFHTALNSPRTPVNHSPHHTPLQQKYNVWSVSDVLQSLGTIGPKKFLQYADAAYSSCISSDTSSLSASSRTASPINSLSDSTTRLDLNELPERKAPGFERSVGNGNVNGNDYQQLRIQAAQAMQGMPNHGEVRIPTQSWAGYGFSNSSPSPIPHSNSRLKDETITNSSPNEEVGNNKTNFNDSVENSKHHYAVSNYLDAASNSTFNVVTSSNYSDLPTHLASLGLQKYIQLFKANEIDLSVFQTLTETDLREIGVSALGARRKMMLFISELKKRDQLNVFRGSAAPGAERKISTPCSSSPQNDSSW